MKSITKKVESNIYVETRGQATRFIVAVYPIPKDSATFSDRAEGLLWARRRRVEFLEQKAGVRAAKSPQAAAVGADPILTHRADRNLTQGGALRF